MPLETLFSWRARLPAAVSTPDRMSEDEGSAARLCSDLLNSFSIESSEDVLPGFPKRFCARSAKAVRVAAYPEPALSVRSSRCRMVSSRRWTPLILRH